MACQECGTEIRVRKGLRTGKSAKPDECPECGSELSEKQDKSLIQK